MTEKSEDEAFGERQQSVKQTFLTKEQAKRMRPLLERAWMTGRAEDFQAAGIPMKIIPEDDEESGKSSTRPRLNR